MKTYSLAACSHRLIGAAILSIFVLGCSYGRVISEESVANLPLEPEGHARRQTSKSVKMPLDTSTLVGKTRSEIKAILGKPVETSMDNCDKLPEWTFRRSGLKRFAVKFDGANVSDVFATFNDLNTSPEACLKIMSLNKADWSADPSTSSEWQHSYRHGRLWASVLRSRDPDRLGIQIMVAQ